MKRVLLPLLAIGFCLVSPLARAASDYLLEIEGIKGESVDATHPGTIEISSFSWGVSNTPSTTAGGAGAGKVSLQDFHFSTRASRGSPLLMLACATGQHIKSAKLFVRKSGADGKPTDYYVITLSDLLVSSYKQSGGGTATGDSLPVDQISLNFASVTVEYTAADGSVSTGTAVRTEADVTGN